MSMSAPANMRTDDAGGFLTVGEDEQFFCSGWRLADAPGDLSRTSDGDVALHEAHAIARHRLRQDHPTVRAIFQPETVDPDRPNI